MHLYIEKGKQKKLLTVELVDGYIPSVVGYSEARQTRLSDSLEPASWFKVMVVASISIDCEKYVIHWTVNSSDSSDVKEYLMFNAEDQSCYDFDDDLDELYQLASFLVRTNPMSILNDRERNDLVEQYEKSIFRLLHCYILDKVALHPEDISQLERAYEIQKQSILQLEDSILMHRRVSEQYSNELRELQQTRILPFFSHIVAHGGCTKDMISLLLENILKDIAKITSDVDTAQRKVDEVKVCMNKGAACSDFSNALAKARGKRDILVGKMTQLLEWREMLTVHRKELALVDINGPMEPVLLKYMNIYEEFQAARQKVTELCHAKVRAVSVRVSIEIALKDLKRGREFYGEGVNPDGQKPTDVIMEDDSNMQWKTLSGKLAAILHDIENPNGKEFHGFTLTVKQRCHEIFRIYERILDTSSVSCSEDIFVVSHRHIDFTQEFENIKAEIRDHLEKSTPMLMLAFRKESQMFAKKLRLCYEKHFFNEVHDCLIRLYRIINSNVMVDLEKRAVRLRDLPVCRLGLQVKNEWWLSLFDPISFDPISYDPISAYSSFHLEEDGSCDSEDQDLCRGYDDGSCKYDKHKSSCNEYLEMDVRRDSRKSYRNVDLIGEKLKMGTAKILSRSWSDLPTMVEKNIVQFGADVMAAEIGSKVSNNLHLMPFRKVIGSLRTPNQASSGLYDGTFSSFDRGYRNRSFSIPNFMNSEFEKKRRLNDQSAASIQRERNLLTLSRSDGFKTHFGSVIHCIREVFKSSSPLNKAQCLTDSLNKLVRTVAKLRSEELCAVSAEDLLPLLALMLLKLRPEEVAKLFVELCFVSDMLVEFLSYGCHSYALTVFQTAFRVLSQVFDELELP